MKSKVFALVLATTIFAFNTNAQVSFGLRAGINLQTLDAKYGNGDKIKYDLRTGFHVGVIAEIHAVSDLHVQTGILFSTKGTQQEFNIYTRKEFKLGLSYLEIPINVLYKPSIGPGKLLLGAGPYVAYAIGGNVKSRDSVGKVRFEKETTGFNSTMSNWEVTYYARRLDVGVNLLFGYEFTKKISVQLNAQLGLRDINSKIKSEVGLNANTIRSQAKNTGFGISVGYKF
ncbi:MULTISPECIES: porin family protein [Niastella]|uniref:PorT family protein n=1 Tax=Niastella soli TaxID=2821487 RepID=A0ABS3YSP2_9BACT|nr:porin family protein [Niastella soli]MBO9200883.1 PorT family protein [Niastella soli]